MLRNVAQKWRVYAYNATTGLPVTGDAANITGRIRIDDGSGAATNDAAPTEADATNEPGYYDFDLTQAETNGAKLSLAAKSSTSNVVVIPCPPVIYTRPQYFSILGIASDGDLSKVNTLEGHTAQTGDAYAIVNSGSHGNAALKTLIDAIDTDVNSIGIMASAIVTDTGELQQDLTDGGRLDLLIDAIKTKTDNLPTSPADQSDITALQTKIKKYFQITLRSDSAIATDNATELGEINADEGSGAGSYIVSYSLAGTFSTLSTYLSGVITLVTTVDTVVDAIKAKTDNLPSDPADQSELAALITTVDTVVDAIKAKTDNLPSDPADQSEIASLLADLQAAADSIAGYLDTEIADILEAVTTTGSDPWSTALPGAYASGTAGHILGNRLVGTIASGTHNPQSGDSYAVVSNATYGNANLKTLIDAIGTMASAIVFDTGELQQDWTDGGRLDLLVDAIKAKTDNLPASPAATGDIPSAATISDAVWDEVIADHSDVGSTGAALAAAGGSGDPWSTALPGAYASGTAGNIIGSRLVGTIASGTHNPQSGDAFARLGAPAGASMSADIAILQASIDAVAGYLDTEIVEILNELQGGAAGDPWAAGIPGSYGVGTAGYVLGTQLVSLITTVDTVVDAIKAKTDNLPSDPADQSQIETALDGFATSLNSTIVDEIADLSANMATAANLAVVDTVADNINAVVTNATYGLQAFHTNVFTAILGQIASGVHHPSSGDAYQQIVNSTASLTSLIASVQDKMIKLFQITLRKDSAIIVDRAVELDNINSNSGTGAGSYSPATDSQEAIRDRGDSAWITGSGGSGGGSGSGARSVTITVNDGSAAIQGAKVRVSQGAESYIVETNSSGVASFSLDDATWTVRITKPGYTFSTTTLVVNGTETVTYSMTEVGLSAPASPLASTGYVVCYDRNLTEEANVVITVQQASGIGTNGYSWNNTSFTITSDNDGLASHSGFARGARYRAKRGSSSWIEFTVPNTSTFTLPELLGTS